MPANNNSTAISRIETTLLCNSGAPMPLLFQNEHEAFLVFWLANDEGIGVIKFESSLCSKMGHPNDEVLAGHPLYSLGLAHYCLHQVHNSPWLAEINKINSVHRCHHSSLFESVNHYIYTFHDSTFECLADSFSERKVSSLRGPTLAELNSLFASEQGTSG